MNSVKNDIMGYDLVMELMDKTGYQARIKIPSIEISSHMVQMIKAELGFLGERSSFESLWFQLCMSDFYQWGSDQLWQKRPMGPMRPKKDEIS